MTDSSYQIRGLLEGPVLGTDEVEGVTTFTGYLTDGVMRVGISVDENHMDVLRSLIGRTVNISVAPE